jgi:stress-induced morphogen
MTKKTVFSGTMKPYLCKNPANKRDKKFITKDAHNIYCVFCSPNKHVCRGNAYLNKNEHDLKCLFCRHKIDNFDSVINLSKETINRVNLKKKETANQSMVSLALASGLSSAKASGSGSSSHKTPPVDPKHNDSKFACDICNKKFSKESFVNRHKNLRHAGKSKSSK